MLVRASSGSGGGGGNVSITPDTNNQLGTITAKGGTFTATEDCIMVGTQKQDGGGAIIYIDGNPLLSVSTQGQDSIGTSIGIFIPKNSVVTSRSSNGTYNLSFYKPL